MCLLTLSVHYVELVTGADRLCSLLTSFQLPMVKSSWKPNVCCMLKVIFGNLTRLYSLLQGYTSSYQRRSFSVPCRFRRSGQDHEVIHIFNFWKAGAYPWFTDPCLVL